jgi:hypothetical protein
LKNFEIACPPLAEAGKKEMGLGKGIFARPRFSAAAEFRANEVGAPFKKTFLTPRIRKNF